VSWLPATGGVRAILLVAHGLHEHSWRYHELGVALAKQSNFATYSIDHVGHGKSSGRPGLIDSHETLVSDFLAFARAVRKEHAPDTPCFLFAHSMGTFVATLAVSKIPGLKAVVFSGHALIPGPATASPFGCACLYPITKTSCIGSLTAMMASMDPHGDAAPIAKDSLSYDEADQVLVENDVRFYHGSMMNKTAYELSKIKDLTQEALPTVCIPVQFHHGGDDIACMPESSQIAFDACTTPAAQKSITIHPGCKHEILHEKEPHKSNFIQTLVAFYTAQLNKDGVGVAVVATTTATEGAIASPSAV